MDLLAVSFSGCDTVGHANGPYSREVTDLLFRLDRSLGALFETLDSSVGEGRWLAALTADHGVLPLPEHLQARGVDARRVGSAEVRAMRATLVERANERLGVKLRVRSASGGLRLEEGKLAGTGVTPERAPRPRRGASRPARRVPLDRRRVFDGRGRGVRAGPARRPRAGGEHVPSRPDARRDRRERPWRPRGRRQGTSHGSPHPYDRDVPLIFYGPGFEAERVPGPAAATTSCRPCSEPRGSRRTRPSTVGRFRASPRRSPPRTGSPRARPSATGPARARADARPATSVRTWPRREWPGARPARAACPRGGPCSGRPTESCPGRGGSP